MPSFTQDAQQPLHGRWKRPTISATDDIGHDHIGHKACHVFVRLVNQCSAASQGSGVADEIPNNLKWTICDIANMLQLYKFDTQDFLPWPEIEE